VREIEDLIGAKTGGFDFEAIEMAARRKAMKIAARVIEQKLNSDISDYVDATRECTCGALAYFGGRRDKVFKTAVGEMTLSRAYYHCDVCESGFFPRDRVLGMAQSSLSPAVIRMNGMAAAMVSFKETSELLSELAGIDVGIKHVERAAENLGCEIAKDESIVTEATIPPAKTMYLGMDGTGLPMRKEELIGREGKDGAAKTREVKLVTVWSAESRDKEGKPVRDEGSVTYNAAIESAAQRDLDEGPSDFAKRVAREARRRDFDKAERRVVIGDGALWIWNLASEFFPGAIQIVDLFHAKEHLSTVAKSIYGIGNELGTQWAKLRHDELDDGKFETLLNALRAHSTKNDDARKCFDYFERNRERMNYPLFRAQGLCVGSGVVEAGCKVAIGTRLKRSGMHWTVRGANAITALRCCKLSGRFEEFWERRSEKTQNSLQSLTEFVDMAGESVDGYCKAI
jgi:hypothetical protein